MSALSDFDVVANYLPFEGHPQDVEEADCPDCALRRIEAELAALKARRCWTCVGHLYLSHGGNSYVYGRCPLYGEDFEADGFCHRWEPRLTAREARP